MPKRWWRKRIMRIYHPDLREHELGDLDVPHFIAECVMTNAEAIVISAGGTHALYPSRVPYHHVSEAAAHRDLLGEIVPQARDRGLKVIAGVDLAKAREEVWQNHPEWFQRRVGGQVARAGEYYVTCPLAGYQNEAFAHPVLREILSTYRVAGFHVSAGGFHGYCTCASCAQAFGGDASVAAIPAGPEADPAAWRRFLRWRGQAIGRQFSAYYDVLREIDDGAFLTAEFAGPESPERALSAGQHLPSLSRAFTQILLSAGGMHEAHHSRYWVAMAADQARAVRRKRNPLINVQAQMRDTKHPHALMPGGEFAHACYQGLAHGAGLTISTSDSPSPHRAIAEVFGFMQQQQRVIDTMEPIAPIALVWPEEGLLQSANPDALRDEFTGLYHALKSKHILMGVLYDEAITTQALQPYQTVVLPGAAWLNGDKSGGRRAGDRAAVLAEFARQEGRLVLVDGPWEPAPGESLSMPKPLASLRGGDTTHTLGQARYALPTPQLPPRLLAKLGTLPLTLPYRRIELVPEATVWLRNAVTADIPASEDPATPRWGEDPLIAQIPVGDGIISYAAFSLGREYLASGHPDLAALLEAMVSERSPYKPLLLTDAPDSIEITLAHWEQGVVVHLVNASGPAPLGTGAAGSSSQGEALAMDHPAPVGPITLDLAWDGPALAELCAPGSGPQALPCEEAWNRVRLVVPRIDAYAQVVVRSA